ncbi:MAG: hypothetical protein OEW66_12650 [Actinomycetota bacterium]|nr:hypothetical protein [Actinomycetota bacterium]
MVFRRKGTAPAEPPTPRWAVPPTPSPRIVRSSLLVAALFFSVFPTLTVATAQADPCGGSVSIQGTPGRDVLVGTSGADVIDAGGGNDVVRGLGGRDVLCGGGGADLLFGGSGSDDIAGGPGKDLVVGGPGLDALNGGPGPDVCGDRRDRLGRTCEWRDRQPRPPILASFYYPWFPEAWDQGGIDPYTQFRPSLGRYDLDRASVRRAHLDAMRWAGMQAGIASWWGRGTRTDRRITPLLRSTDGRGFRWSVYHEGEGQGDPSSAQIAADLASIGARFGTDRNFLRIGGRFVVFVYAEPGDGCEMADRWSGASALGAFVVLKVFSGFEACASQPDAWHQYAPAVAADDQRPYSYSVSPGFWKADEASPRLGRNLDRWRRDVRRMMNTRVTFRLVTTFNEWGEGTAVESAREWRSRSGRGRYLDVLRREVRRAG